VTLPHPTAGPLRVLGTPLKLSDTPGRLDAAPPTLGQHTDAVLTTDLGLRHEEVQRLRGRGIV
jgi:succinate--hydroxymethylglutarate CoA-transferase